MEVQGNGKLGQLLLDEDVITKRQLSKAVQAQMGGDDRKLGEILVGLGYCTLDDITDAVLGTDHEEIKDEVKAEPIEISEEKVLDTKFTLSVQTIVAAGMGLASLIGMWYTLQGEIEEAKQLPSLESLYEQEYPSRPEGYNWPRSYEQYKDQVGTLQEDMDDVYSRLDDMENAIEDLQKELNSLKVVVAGKRDR